MLFNSFCYSKVKFFRGASRRDLVRFPNYSMHFNSFCCSKVNFSAALRAAIWCNFPIISWFYKFLLFQSRDFSAALRAAIGEISKYFMLFTGFCCSQVGCGWRCAWDGGRAQSNPPRNLFAENFFQETLSPIKQYQARINKSNPGKTSFKKLCQNQIRRTNKEKFIVIKNFIWNQNFLCAINFRRRIKKEKFILNHTVLVISE